MQHALRALACHRCATDLSEDDGFSLVELIVSTALTLVVLGAVVGFVNPAATSSQAQPEAIDMQQRIRSAADALVRDLHVAGAGLDAGPMSGPLVHYFPPIQPRRMGAVSFDLPEVARADAISITYVPATHAQSELLTPLALATMSLRDSPGCPPGLPLCGFLPGMGVLVFDTREQYARFTLTDVVGAEGHLRRRDAAPGQVFPVGAHVAEVETRTYYFDAAARQLRVDDNDLSDSPVIDDVVSFAVAYFGETAPPMLPRPPAGEANCLYDAAGARLPGMIVLPPADGALAALPLSMLTDGPWCGAGPTRFDADLLRVRRLRILLRVQAAQASLRGAGPDVVVGGTSRSAWRHLPDLVVSFDVAPRNLNLR
jgi:hypothetical protein